MNRDLKTMTRKELMKLRADIDKALDKLTEKERKAARAAAEKAAASFGFSLDEITDGNNGTTKSPKKVKAPAAPRYRNPDDNSQTWTGKGRQPGWFKAALAAGKSPDDMEI